jgi:hypothetical protein
LGDQASGLAFLAEAVGEVIGAKIAVGHEVVEDVPGGDEDGVSDGEGRALGASVRDQPPKLRAQVGRLAMGGAGAGDEQGGLEPGVAVAGASGQPFAG